MQDAPWWKSAVIYEIYPRSFQDTNADGVGDLRGILQRLDYLVELGVDALWIAPIFPSPMADFGYDIADYCAIDPIFGTMTDFDRLLLEAHRRGLKIILDLVPNHTSSQHPWFLQSRASRENEKRGWYLWRDRPNNWMSNFGGSGWEWDEPTQQYYYHSFLKEQPDLNWRNPQVRAAMYETMIFWLEKGIDGFRVDVMWLMIKDDQYRDNPPNREYSAGQSSDHRYLPVYNANRPEVHAVVAEMRAVIDLYPGSVLIGEVYLPIPELMTYYGENLAGADLPFNFLLLQTPWRASAIADAIAAYMGALPPGAWPNWVLGNHDRTRIASRVGDCQTAVAAMLLLTLPGTVTLYYGDEIGMIDGNIPPSDVRDPAEIRQPGMGLGRDPERTPMLWNSSPSAGFSLGRPWLPLNSDHASVNVEALQQDEQSLLRLYRALIALRRAHPSLARPEIHAVTAEDDLLRYERRGAAEQNPERLAERILVMLNFSKQPRRATFEKGTVLLSTRLDREQEQVERGITLHGGEGLILRVDPM